MSIHRVQLRNLNSQRGSETNTNRNLISYCYSVYEKHGVGFIVFTKCWLEITHLHCAITLTANIYFADYSASPVKIIWQHGGKWNQQFMLVVELRVTDLWRVPLGWSCLDMQRQTRRDVKFISDRPLVKRRDLDWGGVFISQHTARDWDIWEAGENRQKKVFVLQIGAIIIQKDRSDQRRTHS